MKQLFFVRSSQKDLQKLPAEVRRETGHALLRVQWGEVPIQAKALKGFGGADVLELIVRHDGDSYRAVYTVRFAEAVYVLHCFQKKSKSGISTPKQELDLIRQRLRDAENEYREWKKKDQRS